ncbi:MAG: septal ring lytic transglycosylase RlpA family protein [Methylophilus sp.]|uniref:septal ring lytic transglycosylase RlpA family protein n=1 Tax=Methylophilus sp. TaxID=29541 RepID=UPI003FA15B4C
MSFNLNMLGILLLTSLLAACSSSMPPRQTTPSQPPASKTTPTERPAAKPQATAPSTPTIMGPRIINIDPKPEFEGNATDGIDPNTPLETTVTPRLDPIVKSTTKPYIVNGETISPMTTIATPFTQTGHASWYGKKFHGRKTASGEVYDMFKLSAAHKTLPLPSYARVTNLSNRKSVIVRVNDRGPFGRPRIIDLSYAAAKQLDIIQHGSSQVEITLIDTTLAAPATPPAASETVQMTRQIVQSVSSDTPAPASIPTTSTMPATGPEANGIYIQVGAFGQEENADRLQKRISNSIPKTQTLLNKVYNGKLFQVVLGPYPDHALAAQAASQMRDQLQLPALIFSR